MIRVFVYGTLKPGFRNHERWAAPHLLASEPATAAGDLYDLPAGYPGVVEGGGTVHGFVLTLPDAVLASLDELEAYDPAAAVEENEYYRREVPVTLENGEIVPAWIYFMTAERVRQMAGTLLPSGRWFGDR